MGGFVYRSLCAVILEHIGNALEMFATDHSGSYPKSMDELKPQYMKEIPPVISGLSEKEKALVEKKFGTRFEYGYEVSSDARCFTLSCNRPVVDEKGDPEKLIYTSREGMIY